MAHLPSCTNLKTEDAARYLLDHFGVERAPDTLLQLRYRGGGPRYLKDTTSRRVLYPTVWLDEWAGELLRPCRSTSDEIVQGLR
jgi:hypothetical protein